MKGIIMSKENVLFYQDEDKSVLATKRGFGFEGSKIRTVQLYIHSTGATAQWGVDSYDDPRLFLDYEDVGGDNSWYSTRIPSSLLRKAEKEVGSPLTCLTADEAGVCIQRIIRKLAETGGIIEYPRVDVPGAYLA